MVKTQIFVADDEPDVLLMIEESFATTLKHVDIHLAANGADLLKLIRQRKTKEPTLIIADLNMPLKTGVEVLCELRASTSYDLTPILMMTNHPNVRDNEWLHGLGANYVFEKPDSYEGFLRLAATIHQFWMSSQIAEMRDIFNEKFRYEPEKDHSADNFLIVDDSLLHRLQLEKLLKRIAPRSIHYAYDGARAVCLFKSLLARGMNNIIVVMTQELPVMKGHKAAEIIRRHEAKVKGKSNSYIILDSEAEIDAGSSKYYNDLIARPYQFDELIAKILVASKHFDHGNRARRSTGHTILP